MKQYSKLERDLQEAFEKVMPLTPAQSGRLTQLSVALLEANAITISRLARVLPHQTHQASRCQWIQRLLEAPFLSQTHLYHPMLRHALEGFQAETWHILIDRTGLPMRDEDLAMISLSYHKRSIPLYWQRVQKGGATAETYGAMLQQVVRLVPSSQSVVIHGDSEFGSAVLMRKIKALGWNFMLGVHGTHHLYDPRTDTSQPFRDYPIPERGTWQMSDMTCIKSQPIPVNAFAFRQVHHSGGKQRREYCYMVTSLPLTASTRRIGRRRWGIEPLFADYKSAGWQVDRSCVSIPRFCGLLVLLAICYLWLVTTGRWLSKIGQRRKVDSHRHRHYSLFRLGWDWIVHQLKLTHPPPTPFMLYA